MKGYLPLLANNQSFARMGMWQSYDLDDQAKYNQHEPARTNSCSVPSDPHVAQDKMAK